LFDDFEHIFWQIEYVPGEKQHELLVATSEL